MSIQTYAPRQSYTGNGTVSAYTFAFKIQALSQLLVIETDSTGLVVLQRVRGTDTGYLSSVSFDAINGGGTVNLLANLPNNNKLILLLANDAPTQPSLFRNRGSFKLEDLDQALDVITGPIQRLAYLANRAIALSDLDDPTAFNAQLPPGVAGLVGMIPVTNSAGNGWAPVSQWMPVVSVSSAISAAAAALVSATQAATSAGAAAVSAAAALVSQTAAAASAVTAGTDATSATASATSAAGSSSTASTYATNAATSATAAGVSATAAGVSATTATTQANNAATSAATSSTKAGIATTQAGIATTQAAAAGVSATLADVARVLAQAAATAAQASIQPIVIGTSVAPVPILAVSGVIFTGIGSLNKWYINGSGGPITVTNNPQVGLSTLDGARLRLVGGANPVTFVDGNGLNLNGPCVLGLNDVLDLDMDVTGAAWTETGRSMPI